MPKRFNVAGPCIPDRHYMLPAIDRLPEARRLADQGDYFVVHAARQSGKTTLLQALTDEINAAGRQYALYCSLETLQGIDDLAESATFIIASIRRALKWSVLSRVVLPAGETGTANTLVNEMLSQLCVILDKPLVLFFDEADCLSGQALITFLRQLREGYINRARIPFPWSIALAGMRDIRDFKAEVRPGRESLGSASPFNIVTKALTLDNFTREQVAELYRQHTEATGQIFEPEAVDRSWHWTEGQPWLVNALARQVVEDDLERDHSPPVTAGHIDGAAETLMMRRDTHIDSLLERLKEPRVRKVIEPMLSGGEAVVDPLSDDTRFCLDLGLVKANAAGALSPANPIYREVMVRTLTYHAQVSLPENLINRWM
ncbi:MAG: ATP-binding protein, partial [Planctomycetota bacterium]|nr:ATP-binding protein [Planctomycetota bacterium]